MSECNVASSMEVPRSIEGVVLSPIRSANKPRRKRKKKKKKKKRPNSEPLSSDDESLEFLLPLRYETNKTNSFQPKSNASSGESHISTPQDILRQRLIEKEGLDEKKAWLGPVWLYLVSLVSLAKPAVASSKENLVPLFHWLLFREDDNAFEWVIALLKERGCCDNPATAKARRRYMPEE